MQIRGAHSWEFHVYDEKSGVLGNWVEGIATGVMVPKFSD